MLKIPDNCCGCGACATACPKNCIDMNPNDEGFLYPLVNSAFCVDCDLCNKVCPVLNELKPNATPTAFAAVCEDEALRMASSSGGVFSLLAEAVIDNGGVVFGAAFDENFRVRHTAAASVEELAALRTSKYVQSDMGDCFSEAESYLKEGRFVLFTGTACQISGLKCYLRRDYDKLLTQDVFCLGVPSPEVWEEYKKFKSEGRSLVGVSFRHKIPSERTYALRLKFGDGGEIIERGGESYFTKAFVGKLCLRESCYNCAFKGLSRIADITLADFWGVAKSAPEMDDGRGVSLVLVHSAKGRAAFDAIRHKLRCKEVDPTVAVAENPMALRSAYREEKRDLFMQSYKKVGFVKAFERCEAVPFNTKVKRFIKKIIKK